MKIICVGRNYAAHARELKNDVPEAPVLFLKPQTALLQQGNVLYYPAFTTDLHYECELVVKICKNGKHIQEKFAPKYYQEVTVGIDFTARDVQQQLKEKGLPWEISKAFDNSAAIGHWVKLAEGPQIQDIYFSLNKNGQTVQQGHTADMIFSVNALIAHISRYFTLCMGDLLFTGTPAGVGQVNTGDKLEGFLQGRLLLQTMIK
jgi:2-keto-4-pentenoate hydratase/2-oxohepta-3-ene-1,7-dioic acid hydratase in catechol pathway